VSKQVRFKTNKAEHLQGDFFQIATPHIHSIHSHFGSSHLWLKRCGKWLAGHVDLLRQACLGSQPQEARYCSESADLKDLSAHVNLQS
jgi:hypothetical protein